MTGFSALQQFARRPEVAERCELCGVPILAEHDHLLEIGKRRLVCACRACAILFDGPVQRYKRVPARVRELTHFRLTDEQWESLLLPINLVFFYRASGGNVVSMYPSPAGATESLLPLDSWREIAAANPVLASMEADVEALLVNRLREPRYFLLPIDHCFKLVGLVRAHWRGLSGGSAVWREIERFFEALGAHHA